MNAEIFEKKEYADECGKIDFVRICSLVVGQEFLMNGSWRKVHSIEDGRLYHHAKNAINKGRHDSVSAKSQMFVQVAK